MKCTRQYEQFDMSVMQIGCRWKLDPTWPLDDLSIISPQPYIHIWQTIYFCNPYDIASNLTYMKACFEHFLNLTPNLLMRNLYWGRVKSLEILPKYRPTNNVFILTKKLIFAKMQHRHFFDCALQWYWSRKWLVKIKVVLKWNRRMTIFYFDI